MAQRSSAEHDNASKINSTEAILIIDMNTGELCSSLQPPKRERFPCKHVFDIFSSGYVQAVSNGMGHTQNTIIISNSPYRTRYQVLKQARYFNDIHTRILLPKVLGLPLASAFVFSGNSDEINFLHRRDKQTNTYQAHHEVLSPIETRTYL